MSVREPKPVRQLTQQAFEECPRVAVSQREVQMAERLGRHRSVEPYPAGQEELECADRHRAADEFVILPQLPAQLGVDATPVRDHLWVLSRQLREQLEPNLPESHAPLRRRGHVLTSTTGEGRAEQQAELRPMSEGPTPELARGCHELGLEGGVGVGIAYG